MKTVMNLVLTNQGAALNGKSPLSPFLPKKKLSEYGPRRHMVVGGNVNDEMFEFHGEYLLSIFAYYYGRRTANPILDASPLPAA